MVPKPDPKLSVEQILNRFYDDDDGTIANRSKALTEALTQLETLLLSVAPKKRYAAIDSQTGAPIGRQGHIDYGFDQATQEYQDNIKRLFKEQP